MSHNWDVYSTVLEGDSIDVSIRIETSDDSPLDADTVVTLGISYNVGSSNTTIQISRLLGDISLNVQNDPVVSFTVPAGHVSGSTISFTGISVEENDVLDGELQFVLFIEGFSFLETSGEGIFGYTTGIVDDDDDGKFIDDAFCSLSPCDMRMRRRMASRKLTHACMVTLCVAHGKETRKTV